MAKATVKVCTRNWYENNKHVYPANVWESYEPEKKYEKYKKSGKVEDGSKAGLEINTKGSRLDQAVDSTCLYFHKMSELRLWSWKARRNQLWNMLLVLRIQRWSSLIISLQLSFPLILLFSLFHSNFDVNLIFSEMLRWRCPCKKILQRCNSNILPADELPKPAVVVERDVPIEALRNLPKLEPLYSVDSGLSAEDYDSNGELKPLLPEELTLEISSRWSLATPSFPYEPLPESTWELYRRPETGPERKLSTYEKHRAKLVSERIDLEFNDFAAHLSEEKALSQKIRAVGATTYGKIPGVKKQWLHLKSPAIRPLPSGYFNYDKKKTESLVEQGLFRLVGFEHLHKIIDSPKLSADENLETSLVSTTTIEEKYVALKRNLEENFIREAPFYTRSDVFDRFADLEYKQFITSLQENLAKVIGRPLEDIMALQNIILDRCHLNHIDINSIFMKNWELHDLLEILNPEMITVTLDALKNETGITFGNDLGNVLMNCPEYITLSPKIIRDRRESFIGWDFDGHVLGDIIRFCPEAFLESDYDKMEAKIQYLAMRCNCPRDTMAELGLLGLPIEEISAKYEFCYRRGVISRPSKKERRLEMKKNKGKYFQEFHDEKKRDAISRIFASSHEEFLEFCEASARDFEIWIKAWHAELESLDGLAENSVHSLLGMKIPFVINRETIK